MSEEKKNDRRVPPRKLCCPKATLKGSIADCAYDCKKHGGYNSRSVANYGKKS